MRRTYRIGLILLAASAIIGLSVQAEQERGACHGGFRGVANFAQGLVLTATTNAPAGAKGKAEFIAVDDNGTNYEVLFVKTTGLTNGTFTVEVTDDTGTNTYDLGTLNVTNKTNVGWGGRHECPEFRIRDPWGFGTPPAQGWGPSTPAVGWTNFVGECAGVWPVWTNLFDLGRCTNLYSFATNVQWWYTNTLTVGSGSFVLPAGLSQSNAATVTVSDPSGAVDLTGDLAGTTNSIIVYKEIADVVPGTATNAQGTATITYRLVNSKAVGTFQLNASDLPSRTKLYLTANGTNTVRVFTRADGTLKVRSFGRVDVSTISEVVATDTASNIVFSVQF
jgi:hypothetical protein